MHGWRFLDGWRLEAVFFLGVGWTDGAETRCVNSHIVVAVSE